MSIVIDSIISGCDDPDEKDQICGYRGNTVRHDVLSKLEELHYYAENYQSACVNPGIEKWDLIDGEGAVCQSLPLEVYELEIKKQGEKQSYKYWEVVGYAHERVAVEMAQ